MTKPAPSFGWESVVPVVVEDDIRRLCDRLGELTDTLAIRARTSALADAKYKKEYASALLLAEGKTVGDREAVAALETADEYEARKVAEALLMVAQESGRNIRAQLDALRSINANLRGLT